MSRTLTINDMPVTLDGADDDHAQRRIEDLDEHGGAFGLDHARAVTGDLSSSRDSRFAQIVFGGNAIR